MKTKFPQKLIIYWEEDREPFLIVADSYESVVSANEPKKIVGIYELKQLEDVSFKAEVTYHKK